jgi:tRNA pseudouridine38-40 synthase
MARFFLEVAYKGTAYAGFQKQHNANTIQQEVEKALNIYFRDDFDLTGSSRTDAGVHARQNYFHFDHAEINEKQMKSSVYHLNAILPKDIVVKSIRKAEDNGHARFDAIERRYEYTVYSEKDPFMEDRGYYYPYPLDIQQLNEAAEMIIRTIDFETFCKKNTQVQHFECRITGSIWEQKGAVLRYKVSGNRFLRGMVRGLTGTMLRVGSGKMSLEEFEKVIKSGDPTRADFSVPPQGLCLMEVKYQQM